MEQTEKINKQTSKDISSRPIMFQWCLNEYRRFRILGFQIGVETDVARVG